MRIKIQDIPKGKSLDDYSDDTEFVLVEEFPKYEKGTFRKIRPGEDGYEEALTKEEALKLIEQNKK